MDNAKKCMTCMSMYESMKYWSDCKGRNCLLLVQYTETKLMHDMMQMNVSFTFCPVELDWHEGTLPEHRTSWHGSTHSSGHMTAASF